MRVIFDDTDEKEYFSCYLAEYLNKAIGKIAEQVAIEPIVEITPQMIESAIKEYEMG